MNKIDNVTQKQYLELPRAIADANGMPQKGQKGSITSFYQNKIWTYYY